MAPQLVSFCIAAIAILALGAQAQELTVVAYVPFQSQVPPTTTSPGLAGFKDRFKQAYQESLQFINDITGAGLGDAPSIKPIIPDWVYTEASAQATFPYTEEWLGPLQYLIAAPTTLYYYDNDTSSAGFKLINIYEALPEGTTFDIMVASPPPNPPGITSPPSPPPPIFPRSPPSPRPPRPPPKPPAPRDNSTVDLVIVSNVYSSGMPLMNDTGNFTLFLNTFYSSFGIMMDCANATSNSSIFNSTAAATNATLIASVCFNNATFNSSSTNTTGFPLRPTTSNVTQELVNDPLANITQALDGATTDPVSARRRQLLDFNTRTCPRGKSWNVTITALYTEISFGNVDIYITAQVLIVNGQRAILVIVLVFVDLVLVQAAFILLLDGSQLPITPTVPGYTKTGSTQGSNGAGRRLIERHTAALGVSAASIKWADVDPSDVAYGTDKSLYEVFSVSADYYTAGAACAARGAKLASYSSEGAQIFIDILCDGAAGMQCWVEGNANGACNAVSSSTVRPLSCGKAMPFVCVKDKSAIVTRTVSSNTHTVTELALEKPTDVAYDTHKNLYEIFSTPVNYHTAGSVCLARGAQLANYGSEASQVFIDVLCEAAAGQTCWVEGNKAGRCSAIKASDVHQVSCTGLQPFVCTKKATAKKAQK